MIKSIPLAFLLSFAAISESATPNPPHESPLTGKIERFIAIDNVCAWPNLTVQSDGTIVAAIFNRPSHGLEEGSIEAWASKDGRLWEKRGTVAPHEANSNRMHVAAGLAKNGDLVAISTGFANKYPPGERWAYGIKLSAWVCRSNDGGRNWTQSREFPASDGAWNVHIPFGNIVEGEDGALHACCYQDKSKGPFEPGVRREFRASHFRSDDDGRTWRITSVISAMHNETSLFRLGGKKWLAAARQEDDRAMDLFRSDDDGETWQGPQRVTGYFELNAHLGRLQDGRLLLSYGNRSDRANGPFGVLAKLSRDEGKTWSAPIRLAHSVGRDCGYPSSVQRSDGVVVTAYYSAGVADHNRYHMGVVLWTPPP